MDLDWRMIQLGTGLKEESVAVAQCFKDQRQFATKDGIAPTG
jgi:hypothetical protein